MGLGLATRLNLKNQIRNNNNKKTYSLMSFFLKDFDTSKPLSEIMLFVPKSPYSGPEIPSLKTAIESSTHDYIFKFGQKLITASPAVTKRILSQLVKIAADPSPLAQELALTIVEHASPNQIHAQTIFAAAQASPKLLAKVSTPPSALTRFFNRLTGKKTTWHSLWSSQNKAVKEQGSENNVVGSSIRDHRGSAYKDPVSSLMAAAAKRSHKSIPAGSVYRGASPVASPMVDNKAAGSIYRGDLKNNSLIVGAHDAADIPPGSIYRGGNENDSPAVSQIGHGADPVAPGSSYRGDSKKAAPVPAGSSYRGDKYTPTPPVISPIVRHVMEKLNSKELPPHKLKMNMPLINYFLEDNTTHPLTFINSLSADAIAQFSQDLARASSKIKDEVMRELPEIARYSNPLSQQLALTIIRQIPCQEKYMPYVVAAAQASTAVLKELLTPKPKDFITWMRNKFSSQRSWSDLLCQQDVDAFLLALGKDPASMELRAILTTAPRPTPWHQPWLAKADFTRLSARRVTLPAVLLAKDSPEPELNYFDADTVPLENTSLFSLPSATSRVSSESTAEELAPALGSVLRHESVLKSDSKVNNPQPTAEEPAPAVGSVMRKGSVPKSDSKVDNPESTAQEPTPDIGSELRHESVLKRDSKVNNSHPVSAAPEPGSPAKRKAVSRISQAESPTKRLRTDLQSPGKSYIEQLLNHVQLECDMQAASSPQQSRSEPSRFAESGSPYHSPRTALMNNSVFNRSKAAPQMAPLASANDSVIVDHTVAAMVV